MRRGYTREEITEKIKADAFLKKPFNIDELKAKIFSGVKNVELSFIATGSGSRAQGSPVPEHFGQEEREELRQLAKVNENRRELYTSSKIIIAKLALRIEGFVDVNGEYSSINTNCIHTPKNGIKLEYLAGIINSKMLSFIYSEIFSGLKMSGGYFQFQAPQLRILPIVIGSEQQQTKIVEFVKNIISLNQSLSKLKNKSTDEKARLEKEIQKLDSEIDEEVYKLYGITEEEKKIIEESLK